MTTVTKNGTTTVTQSESSKYEWLQNDELFDDFYASVFMKLTQIETLIQAEAAICLEEFSRNVKKEHLHILDAGCGVGIATFAFKKLGVKSVVGLDKSRAMIQYARNTVLPNTTLTDIEKQDIEFRNMDLLGPTSANAAEFTHACILYFTIYYFRDLDTLFRNLALWVKPGGSLAIEVVNKYKFEPILNPSNPWVGISPQKYAKERLHKSAIVFDTFEYESVFELEDPRAEFRETFRFKDGSVRRQKHTLYMRSIPEMVKIAKEAGARVVRDGSESDAYLSLPAADLDSQMNELLEEGMADLDFQIKSRAKQFMQLLQTMQEVRKGVREARHQSGI
jgi:SAM-dependent methyltransferase